MKPEYFIRKVELTDAQFERLNHYRERAGVTPLTRQEAVEFLSVIRPEDYLDIMNLIGS